MHALYGEVLTARLEFHLQWSF